MRRRHTQRQSLTRRASSQRAMQPLHRKLRLRGPHPFLKQHPLVRPVAHLGSLVAVRRLHQLRARPYRAARPQVVTYLAVMPPSRIIVLDATPKIWTGISSGVELKKCARSASSLGINKASAAPPTRNHVNGARETSARRLPRTLGNLSKRLKACRAVQANPPPNR